MPRVPSYSPRVGLQGIPSARRQFTDTPESLGAGVELEKARTAQVKAGVFGQAADSAVSLFARQEAFKRREAEQAMERGDDLAILHADNGVSEWSSRALNDALQVEGSAVLGMPTKVLAEYDKVADSIEAGLNPRQRDRFAFVRSKKKLALHSDLERHVSGAMDRFAESEVTNKLALVVSFAGTHAQDPEKVVEELAAGEAVLMRRLQTQGYGPESDTAQAALLGLRTKVHDTAIKRLLSLDQFGPAQQWFTAAKKAGQISGEKIDEIETALEQDTLRGQAQKAALDITRAGGTQAEQLAKVDEITDSKLQDEVRARVKIRHAEEDSAKRDTAYANNLTLNDYIDGKNPTLHGLQKQTDANGTVIWNTLTGGERSAAQARLTHKIKGEPVEPGGGTFYRLRELVDDDQDAFMKTNLQAVRGAMSDGEFSRLLEFRSAIKQGKRVAESDKHLDGDGEMARRVFAESWAQYTGSDATPTDAQQTKDPLIASKIAFMRRTVRDEVERLPKTATASDVQKVVDSVFSQQVQTPGKAGYYWGLGSTAATTKPIYDLTIADVPSKDKAQIVEALRVSGEPVSDATILARYLKRLVKR